MQRRKFLKLTGLGAGALVAVPGFGFAATTFEAAATGILQNQLDYLTLEPEGVEKFIQEFTKDRSNDYRLKVRAMYVFGISPEHSFTVDELVRAYLLSTDFFMNQTDERKPVKYIGLYNPYTRPCTQPFSFLYYPSQTS